MEFLKKHEPIFSDRNDTIAYAVHTAFILRECKLVGLKDNEFNVDKGITPQGWNKSNQLYIFKYAINKKSPKKDKTILIKILNIDDNTLIISGINQSFKKNKLFSINIDINDHLNKKINLKKFNTIYQNLDDLLLLINEQIVDKVLPKPKKDKNENNNNDEAKENKPKNPLLIEQNVPRRPFRPNFNDPFGGYGNGDLDPFGNGNGGGMLIGPNNIGGMGGIGGVGKRKGKPKFDPFGPSPNSGPFGGPNPKPFNPPGGGFGGFI